MSDLSTLITVVRGDDSTTPVKFYETINEVRTPIDITGYEIQFTVKCSLDDPDTSALISKDIAVHTDPVNGESAIVLTNADTSIAIGSYKYDVQIVSPGGAKQTPLIGTFVVKNDVTKR